MGRPGMMFYFEWMEALDYLSAEEFGQMMRKILAYCQFGTQPEFEARDLKIAWGMIRPKLDADRRSYEAKVEKSRKAINTRWDRIRGNTSVSQVLETDTEIETDTDTERQSETQIQSIPAGGFEPPRAYEVDGYSLARFGTVVGKAFVEHFNANGWMIDGKPMTDWRKAVDRWNWEAREDL